MHKNKVWQFFLVLLLCGVLWQVVMTGIKVVDFVMYSQTTSTIETQYKVEKVDSGFVIFANYSYTVESTKYHGTSLLGNRVFPNPWIATREMNELSTQLHTVYFKSRNPEDSTLQKIFPTKSFVYTVVLILVWIYFMFLGIWYRGNYQD